MLSRFRLGKKWKFDPAAVNDRLAKVIPASRGKGLQDRLKTRFYWWQNQAAEMAR